MPDYPDIKRYVWVYNTYYKVNVERYMINQGLPEMYLGFLYDNKNVIAVYK